MAVIPLARQTQVTAQVPQVALASPVGQGADPVVSAVNEGLQGTSKLIETLAQQEREQLDALFRTQIAADISEFEVQERARLIQLEAQGTGDESFTTVALRGFEERAANIGTKYSDELRNEVRARLMPLRQTISLNAVAIEQRKYETNILANAETVQYILANKVSIGEKSQEAALAEIEQLTQNVPDNLRLGVQLKMKEAIQTASLENILRSNPSEAISRLDAGDFIELNPALRARAYDRAQDTIARQAEARARQQEKFIEGLNKDPVGTLRAVVGEGATREQLVEAQLKSGVPWWKVAVLSEAEAKQSIEMLQNARDEGEMLQALSQIQATAGENWDIVRRDITRFAKQEGIPDFGFVMQVMTPETMMNYDSLFRRGVFQTARSPIDGRSGRTKAGAAAAEALGKTKADQVAADVAAALEEHLPAMGNRTFEERQRTVAFMTDAAIIAMAEAEKSGKKNYGDKIKDIVVPPRSLAVLRNDNTGSYYVPADLDRTLSPRLMEEFRLRTIREEKLRVPASLPNADLLRRQLERDARWVTGEDEGTYALEIAGVPVYQEDGRPIIRRQIDFVKAANELIIYERDNPPEVIAGSRSRPAQYVRGDSVPRPTPNLRPPLVTQPISQGGLVPPSASGKKDESLFPTRPTGDINLLPPPTYENE
jgi:hypothetical protein